MLQRQIEPLGGIKNEKEYAQKDKSTKLKIAKLLQKTHIKTYSLTHIINLKRI